MYKRAVNLAIEKHSNQFRITGVPYIVHPIAVSIAVRNILQDENKIDSLDNLMAAAVLHDIVEDCDVTVDELKEWFNEDIANIVGELTNNTDKANKTEYLKNKLVNMSESALFIKLCDRLDNVSDTPNKNYIESTAIIMKHLMEKRQNIPPYIMKMIIKINKIGNRHY